MTTPPINQAYIRFVGFSLLAFVLDIVQQLLDLLLVATNSAVCSSTLPGDREKVVISNCGVITSMH